MTSIGCKGNCTFCGSGTIFPGAVQTQNARRVFNEIKYYWDRDIRVFFVPDDNFPYDKNLLRELKKMLSESQMNIEMFIFARVDSIDDETAGLLADIGVRTVSMGVETGDERLSKRVLAKGLENPNQRALRANTLLKKHNLRSKFFMMVGLPEQDWESILKSAELIREARPTEMEVAITMPYPGTILARKGTIRKEGGLESLHHGARVGPKKMDRAKSLNVTTSTDAMNSSEITVARQLLINLFKATQKKDTHAISILMATFQALATGGDRHLLELVRSGDTSSIFARFDQISDGGTAHKTAA